jgi:hypothetical protein
MTGLEKRRAFGVLLVSLAVGIAVLIGDERNGRPLSSPALIVVIVAVVGLVGLTLARSRRGGGL